MTDDEIQRLRELANRYEYINRAEVMPLLDEIDRLRLSPEECEALRWLRKNAPQVGGPGGHGMSDHVARLDALAALDKVLAANGRE